METVVSPLNSTVLFPPVIYWIIRTHVLSYRVQIHIHYIICSRNIKLSLHGGNSAKSLNPFIWDIFNRTLVSIEQWFHFCSRKVHTRISLKNYSPYKAKGWIPKLILKPFPLRFNVLHYIFIFQLILMSFESYMKYRE